MRCFMSRFINSVFRGRGKLPIMPVAATPLRRTGDGRVYSKRLPACFMIILVSAALVISPAPAYSQADRAEGGTMRHLQTDAGLHFVIWGKKELSFPVPVLFILSGDGEETLTSDYFRQCGSRLALEDNWLCVSLDLPYHGAFVKKADERGLEGWAAAARRKEDFVTANNSRMKAVLDYLIGRHYADTAGAFVCGTSRGGYLALHFAAYDKRIKAVAAFSPVTELNALREFEEVNEDDLLPVFDLGNRLGELSCRKSWIVIGDRDDRVDTDRAVKFARELSRVITKNKASGSIELAVMPEPLGHTTPAGAADRAVEWFREQASR